MLWHSINRHLIDSSLPHKNPKGLYIQLQHFPVSLKKWRIENPIILLLNTLFIPHVDHIANNDTGKNRFHVYTTSLLYTYKLHNKDIVKKRSTNTTGYQKVYIQSELISRSEVISYSKQLLTNIDWKVSVITSKWAIMPTVVVIRIENPNVPDLILLNMSIH